MDDEKSTKRKKMMLRRRAVATLFEEGITNQHDIAEYLDTRFGITNDEGQPFNQATISRDLKALDKQWQSQATEKVEKIKARLLAKYERLYYEAFTAWLRSLEDEVTKTFENVESGSLSNAKGRVKSQERVKGQSGNPALLGQADNALKAIRELFGTDVSDETAGKIDLVSMTLDQWQQQQAEKRQQTEDTLADFGDPDE